MQIYISKTQKDRCMKILSAIYFAIEELGGKVNNDFSLYVRDEHVTIEIEELQDKVTHELTKEEAKKLLEYEESQKRHTYGYKPNIRKYDYVYNGKLKITCGNRKYIRENDGQMAYFDGQSTFELLDDVPFINLDISQLEERFARPLAQQILLSWIWEKYVKKNSEDKNKAKKKRVLIDEAWMLLPYPEAVDFLNTMARRARKRNVSLCVMSQKFQDFYEKPEVQAVLTSSDTKLFLAQDKSEIQYLKEVFKLSEGEASFLVTCQKGEGLLKVGADTAILKIVPTKKEFEFVETNLNKLAQRKQN